MKLEKLKKGCGKNFQVSINGNILEFECGRWRDLPGTSLHSKMIWCPLCAEKIIEELDNALAKKKVNNNETCKVFIEDGTWCGLKAVQFTEEKFRCRKHALAKTSESQGGKK